MARPLRFQYAGATYHVMARGGGGKAVFEEDKDRFDFLDRLGKVCASHGWLIHAWVLMGNHFHLLVETPEPNLVTGMKKRCQARCSLTPHLLPSSPRPSSIPDENQRLECP